jgi:polysaccharide biosynthesis protein PslG
MKAAACVLMVLALCGTACGPPPGAEADAIRAEPPPPVPAGRNPFGLNVHSVPFDTAQWDRIEWLGVGWVRIDVTWWAVNRAAGSYEWARVDGTVAGAVERGLGVMAVLSGTPAWVLEADSPGGWAANQMPPDGAVYEAFVREAVRRYRPGGVLARQRGWDEAQGVRVWEVWNEPDLREFWLGTAAEWRERIWLPGARAIRAEDPLARIAPGGLCCFEPGGGDPWAQGGSTAEVFATEESRRLMDVLSLHHYPRSVERTAVLDPYREMDRWLQGAQAFLDGLGRGQVPIWLTETGFPLSTWGPELQDVGLRRLVGRVLLGPSNRLLHPAQGRYLLEKLFVFNSISPDWGLYELDPFYRPRRAGLAYRHALHQAFDVLGR